MIILDTNVLLAAHRNDHPHFEIAQPWLESALASPESIGVPDVVWASFFRIATSRRIFKIPTPLEAAFDFADAVVGAERYAAVNPGPRHLAIFRQICVESDVVGDLIADAFLAAIAVENGCGVASFDRDFARFENVGWIRPG